MFTMQREACRRRDRQTVNAILDNIYETGCTSDADGNLREAFPASLCREDGTALYRVVCETHAKRTLEIGMAFGVSTLFICQAHHDEGGGDHTAIDPHQQRWWTSVGKLNVERAGFADMVRCIEQPSYEVLPKLLEAEERFDFVFIDGNHRFEYTLVDFFYIDRLLNVGGHVMLHDPWLPAIRKVLSFVLRNREQTYEIAPEFVGGPHRTWGWFRAFLKTWVQEPLDFNSARVYAARPYFNHCVLKKIAEHDPESYDQAWDFYRSF